MLSFKQAPTSSLASTSTPRLPAVEAAKPLFSPFSFGQEKQQEVKPLPFFSGAAVNMPAVNEMKLLLLVPHCSPLVRRRRYPPQPHCLLTSVIVQVEVQERT